MRSVERPLEWWFSDWEDSANWVERSGLGHVEAAGIERFQALFSIDQEEACLRVPGFCQREAARIEQKRGEGAAAVGLFEFVRPRSRPAIIKCRTIHSSFSKPKAMRLPIWWSAVTLCSSISEMVGSAVMVRAGDEGSFEGVAEHAWASRPTVWCSGTQLQLIRFSRS